MTSEIDGAFLDAVVVDDDEGVRATLVGMLRRLGQSALGLDPDKDIIAAVKTHSPGLILLDLSLGNHDAIEVIHSLHDAAFQGLIQLISGRDAATLNSVREIGVRHGLEMLTPLTKPIRLDDLRASLAAEVPLTAAAPSLFGFDLQEAIDKHWLELWYQPQLTLSTLTLRGVEALLRMRHPTMGLIPPAAFIPSAGRDEYEAMTGFVIETIARDALTFRRLGWNFPISMNASIGMLQSPSFINMIRSAWPRPTERYPLIVEITEDELVKDMDQAREIAVQLGLYDIALSIDDFGSGFSSFSTLNRLPIAEIKLDKSFVMGSADNDRLKAFCAATASLASQLGIQSVAEGIETAGELEVVREAGFTIGQGYYFSKPIPLADLVDKLHAFGPAALRPQAMAS